MDAFVFAAVLVAAACHAGWNSLLKLKVEPLLAVTLIAVASGLVVVPLIPFTPLPDAASWPYLAASLLVHLVYYTSLGLAYRSGDLGQVYPIARGTGPLLTAAGTTVLLGERLGLAGWSGILLLASGVVALSVRGGRQSGSIEGRAVGFALLTAAAIGAYSIIDGIGGRLSGAVAGYIVWFFALDGVMMIAFGLWQWGRQFSTEFRRAWLVILTGGAMSTAAYAIALWAMTKAPIALVAALRESSVLFAALIGVVVLGEPLIRLRVIAGGLVLAGMVLLRLRDVL